MPAGRDDKHDENGVGFKIENSRFKYFTNATRSGGYSGIDRQEKIDCGANVRGGFEAITPIKRFF